MTTRVLFLCWMWSTCPGLLSKTSEVTCDLGRHESKSSENFSSWKCPPFIQSDRGLWLLYRFYRTIFLENPRWCFSTRWSLPVLSPEKPSHQKWWSRCLKRLQPPLLLEGQQHWPCTNEHRCQRPKLILRHSVWLPRKKTHTLLNVT